MLCSMAPVGLPLLRALPLEVYTQKPFPERSSRQHDRPSQDRCGVVTRMAPMDYDYDSCRACGVRLRNRVFLYGRRFVRAAEFGLTDCACGLLHAMCKHIVVLQAAYACSGV
jgi:hypothetical protein